MDIFGNIQNATRITHVPKLQSMRLTMKNAKVAADKGSVVWQVPFLHGRGSHLVHRDVCLVTHAWKGPCPLPWPKGNQSCSRFFCLHRPRGETEGPGSPFQGCLTAAMGTRLSEQTGPRCLPRRSSPGSTEPRRCSEVKASYSSQNC